jgi:23S rRNA (guanosine2251-2'-O)-methyltransferase
MKQTAESNTSLVLIAHDIRSAHNVGALFRTASGAGIEKIFLTGYTLVPPKATKLYLSRAEKDLQKTALGAEAEVPFATGEVTAVIADLKQAGYKLIGLEQAERAVDYRTPVESTKVALLIGTEVMGIPEELQALCDALYEIPMHGAKNSLNVSVATGIALYQIQSALEVAN